MVFTFECIVLHVHKAAATEFVFDLGEVFPVKPSKTTISVKANHDIIPISNLLMAGRCGTNDLPAFREARVSVLPVPCSWGCRM